MSHCQKDDPDRSPELNPVSTLRPVASRNIPSNTNNQQIIQIILIFTYKIQSESREANKQIMSEKERHICVVHIN